MTDKTTPFPGAGAEPETPDLNAVPTPLLASLIEALTTVSASYRRLQTYYQVQEPAWLRDERRQLLEAQKELDRRNVRYSGAGLPTID